MFGELIEDNEAFIFGFDNVIYPEKDYLLQVYYLFSEFIEYAAQVEAKQILAFMQVEFIQNGAQHMFQKTASQFNIPTKYLENFDKLHENARLPLKLLMYKQVLALMQEIVVGRKQMFVLMEGNALQQINKLKQVEWNGLEQYLKIYFVEESVGQTVESATLALIAQNKLSPDSTMLMGNDLTLKNRMANLGLKYYSVLKLL